MAVNTLHDKFQYHLQEMYYIENELLDTLEELESDIHSDKLKEDIEKHREETKSHVERLEDVFGEIGEEPEEGSSNTFDALQEDREEILEEIGDDEDLQDLCNLGAALKTEYVEIAGYDNLIMMAKKLDLPSEVRRSLEENLSEEEQAKRDLKTMAEDTAVGKIFTRLMG